MICVDTGGSNDKTGGGRGEDELKHVEGEGLIPGDAANPDEEKVEEADEEEEESVTEREEEEKEENRHEATRGRVLRKRLRVAVARSRGARTRTESCTSPPGSARRPEEDDNAGEIVEKREKEDLVIMPTDLEESAMD